MKIRTPRHAPRVWGVAPTIAAAFTQMSDLHAPRVWEAAPGGRRDGVCTAPGAATPAVSLLLYSKVACPRTVFDC